ncbi:MAG: RluA family pseudouridine synthase [Chlamydiae bacterium]|nr:RluA family pseudouridine synthase [Chlamydiota bacterium]
MTLPEQELIISKQDELVRLDKFLSKQYPSYSRTYFQFLIENGAVLVNGERIKKNCIPTIGDEIEVCFLLTPEISLEPEDIPIEIIYEDEDLLAINKQPNLVVHPAPGNVKGTFVNALLFHCANLKGEFSNLRPGIVHRLDKDTSGVLIAAKNYETHQKIIKLFSEREIKKTYLAICVGNPGNGVISAPIKRHPRKRKEMAVSEEGKEAISHVKVLKKNDPFSLVEVHPITGRTHQIRVHLKYKNSPILGDPIYGNSSINAKYQASRQMLHAYRLEFFHPSNNKPLKLEAEIPKDMQNLLDKLKF